MFVRCLSVRDTGVIVQRNLIMRINQAQHIEGQLPTLLPYVRGMSFTVVKYVRSGSECKPSANRYKNTTTKIPDEFNKRYFLTS